MPKLLFVSIAALLAAAFVVAGCGGGSTGGGGEPAGVMPKKSPVFLEANLQPDGKTDEAVNEVANTVFGIDDVGEFIAEELEKAALGEGEKLDFEGEVEPWLGEKVGLYLSGYDGNDFHDVGAALETTDTGEAEEFIEGQIKKNDNGTESGEFEGHKFYVEPDEVVLGMIGDYLSFAQTKGDFEEMVEAFEGEGLNESPKFKEAMDGAPDEGIGHVYVDIGGLIEETNGTVPPEAEAFFDLIQVEPKKATAVATVIPHSEQVEIDLSSNLDQGLTGTGDATAALEALPASAVLGFASPEFGKSFAEGVESIDEAGVPGDFEPGQLGAAFEVMGIDLKSLSQSLGDLAGFVEGTSESNLGGAVVISAEDADAAKSMVSDIGLVLRESETEGMTPLEGDITGFSVRVPELGPTPLIVGAAGEKIVIAYGPKAAAQALRSQATTLGTTPGFEAAKGTLGSTPMSAYVSGGPMLRLVETLLSPEEQAEIAGAKPYLEKIDYLAAGSEAEGGTTTTKLIIGLAK